MKPERLITKPLRKKENKLKLRQEISTHLQQIKNLPLATEEEINNYATQLATTLVKGAEQILPKQAKTDPPIRQRVPSEQTPMASDITDEKKSSSKPLKLTTKNSCKRPTN